MALQCGGGGYLTPNWATSPYHVSMCAWVYLTAYPNPGCLIEKGWDNPADRCFVWQMNGSQPGLHTLTGDTGYGVVDPGSVPLNTWTHIAAAMVGSGALYLWRNGVYVAGAAVPGPGNGNGYGLGIGIRYRQGGTWPLAGLMADVQIWINDVPGGAEYSKFAQGYDPRYIWPQNRYAYYPMVDAGRNYIQSVGAVGPAYNAQAIWSPAQGAHHHLPAPWPSM